MEEEEWEEKSEVEEGETKERRRRTRGRRRWRRSEVSRATEFGQINLSAAQRVTVLGQHCEL